MGTFLIGVIRSSPSVPNVRSIHAKDLSEKIHIIEWIPKYCSKVRLFKRILVLELELCVEAAVEESLEDSIGSALLLLDSSFKLC